MGLRARNDDKDGVSIGESLFYMPFAPTAGVINKKVNVDARYAALIVVVDSPSITSSWAMLGGIETTVEHEEKNAILRRMNVRSSIEGIEIDQNRDLIESFLLKHEFLGSLLFEIKSQVPKNFTSPNLKLEILDDPESPNASTLLLLISTDSPRSVAKSSLQAFDREWWLGKVAFAKGKLSIDLG